MDEPVVDPQRIREVMGHYPTGVTVVTGMDEQGPIGLVVGTFTSVSLDPPLVAFLPQRSSGSFARLKAVGRYCVNVVAADQLELCRQMAIPSDDKFRGVQWEPSALGAPVLADAVAHVHCTSEQTIEAGDHFIELCRVHDLDVARPVTPLLFFQGGYGGFSTHGLTVLGDTDLISAARLAETAQPQLEKIARELGCESAALVPVGHQALVAGAGATGRQAETRQVLGERVPLLPPLGEAYVAFADDATREAWLGRAQDPGQREGLVAHLDAVRERGYSLSLAPADEAVDLSEALAEYATGGLTPARLRAVQATIARAAALFEPVDLDPQRRYDVGTIAVPVRDPAGEVVLVLRLTGLAPDADGTQVGGWVGALRSAAHAVERSLAGSALPELDDYLSWVHEGY